MTTLTLPLRPAEAPDAAGLTLGERLAGAWVELHGGRGTADCPVCSERMMLAGDAGRCSGCGSELH